jgi:hypothetical protein
MSYDSVILADSPVGYWKLDETSGTTAADSSGNGRNGTYSGSVRIGAPSINENIAAYSTSMNGTSNYVAIAYNAAFATTPLSLEAWVYPYDGGDNSGTVRNIFSCTQSGGWDLSISSTGNSISCRAYIAGAYRALSYSPSYVPDSLYHVVMTYSGRYLKFYVNGSLIDTYDHGSDVAITYSVNNSRMIGAGPNNTTGADANSFYSGRVSNVAYYNAALSDAQVLAHYEAGFTSLAGNITESLAISKWRVTAHKCADGSPQGTVTSTGGTYTLPCTTPHPCNITCAQHVDRRWTTGLTPEVGDLWVPSNPETTPHLFECTTSGAVGGSEPTWDTTPTNTTSDGSAVWTCVGPLVDPITLGPKIPT